MEQISIAGEQFFADLIGRLNDGRIVCLGYVGRKTGIERSLIHLYRGKDVVIAGRMTETLGEKAYRVYKSPLGKGRAARAYVLPSNSLIAFGTSKTDAKPGKEKAEEKSTPPILLWREGADADPEDRIWSHIRNTTPVPTLECWKGPVMDRLRPLMVANISEPQQAIAPITFSPDGDGRWRGVAIRLAEEQIAEAVQDALRKGDVAIPENAFEGQING